MISLTFISQSGSFTSRLLRVWSRFTVEPNELASRLASVRVLKVPLSQLTDAMFSLFSDSKTMSLRRRGVSLGLFSKNNQGSAVMSVVAEKYGLALLVAGTWNLQQNSKYKVIFFL